MKKDLGYRELWAYTYYCSECIIIGKDPKNWIELDDCIKERILKIADQTMEAFLSGKIKHALKRN